MRIKIIKDYEDWRVGQVVKLSKKRAELLLKSGVAIITRDVSRNDFKES